MNEDELAEVMAEEAAAEGGVDKRDPYAFGLGKKVRVRPTCTNFQNPLYSTDLPQICSSYDNHDEN